VVRGAVLCLAMAALTPLTIEPDTILTATCRACGHASKLDIPTLATIHGHTPIEKIAKNLRCRACGDLGSILTVRYDDPRYPT
jgi:hypothetical protein